MNQDHSGDGDNVGNNKTVEIYNQLENDHIPCENCNGMMLNTNYQNYSLCNSCIRILRNDTKIRYHRIAGFLAFISMTVILTFCIFLDKWPTFMGFIVSIFLNTDNFLYNAWEVLASLSVIVLTIAYSLRIFFKNKAEEYNNKNYPLH